MKTRAEVVRDQLLSDITQGYYPPEIPLPPIKRLARSFGVSISTAQEAIRLLQEEGVLESIRRKGTFVRYPLSSRSRGKRVALLVPREEAYLDQAPYPRNAIRELRRGLEKEGYQLEPLPIAGEALSAVVERLRREPWAAVVVFELESYTLLDSLREMRLPVISMDYDFYRMGVPSACFDNLHGGLLAGRHLVELGHRQVLVLRPTYARPLKIRRLEAGNVLLDPVEDDRIRGMELAFKETEGSLRIETYPAASQVDVLSRLLKGRPSPTALVLLAAADAQRVACDLRALNYRIPADVSVVGFGRPTARLGAREDLCVVRTDDKGLGRTAARLVQDAILGLPARRDVLPVQWIQGQTVGKAAPRRFTPASTPHEM